MDSRVVYLQSSDKIIISVVVSNSFFLRLESQAKKVNLTLDDYINNLLLDSICFD